jgi:flagellar export protein FliJ
MRRFRFPLDPALRLRTQLEEQAEMKLAESHRRLQQSRAAVEEIERQIQLHDRLRCQWQLAQIDPGALSAVDPYRQERERAREAGQAALREAQETVERCLLEYCQRRMDRETLDRLRERRRAEHREQALQDEQKSLDEAAVLRWRRN